MTYSRDDEEIEDPMIKFTHSSKAHTMRVINRIIISSLRGQRELLHYYEKDPP